MDTATPCIHLTITGPGSIQERTICQAKFSPNNTYWHWMYCTEDQRNNPNVCQACKTFLDTQED